MENVTSSLNSRWTSAFLLIAELFSQASTMIGMSMELFDMGTAMDVGPSQAFTRSTNLSSLSSDPSVKSVMSFLSFIYKSKNKIR